jgi:hypothetical protein
MLRREKALRMLATACASHRSNCYHFSIQQVAAEPRPGTLNPQGFFFLSNAWALLGFRVSGFQVWALLKGVQVPRVSRFQVSAG